MIKKITISNFKSLKNIELNLGQFNILCGTNASGKSSLIQAILLMAQNLDENNEIILNGELLSLGEFIETKNFDASIDVPVSITLEAGSDVSSVLIFNQDDILKKSVSFPKINNQLYYLAANRIGNSDVFERASRKNVFGLLGEYSISFLSDNKDTPMPDSLIFDKEQDTAHIFYDEVNYWMKRITGSTLKVDRIEKTTLYE